MTKTRNNEGELVYINKYALGLVPHHDTQISKNHKIFFNNQSFLAKSLVGICAHTMSHNGTLYNIVLDDHSYMHVNGLCVETLCPNNFVAKLFDAMSLTDDTNMVINELSDAINKHARITT